MTDDDSLSRLDDMGEALIQTLQRVFPYTVKLAPRSGLTRSIWCTEKVHSILHGSHNIRQVGRSRNISCQVTEAKLKDAKAKGTMTNKNPATYGYSIMFAEVRECAARQMAQDADQFGTYQNVHVHILNVFKLYLTILVCIMFVSGWSFQYFDIACSCRR